MKLVYFVGIFLCVLAYRLTSQLRKSAAADIQEGTEYKIIYHVGKEIDIKTKAMPGKLVLRTGGIDIAGPMPISVPFGSSRSVRMFRLHGLGRLIKLTFEDQALFFAIVRWNLWGYFAIVNFFETGKLLERLEKEIG